MLHLFFGAKVEDPIHFRVAPENTFQSKEADVNQGWQNRKENGVFHLIMFSSAEVTNKHNLKVRESKLGWKVGRQVKPFLGQYSSSVIEVRQTSRKLVVVESLSSQARAAGLLMSFGLYLTYVAIFHFKDINGGFFGIAVIAAGGAIGLCFGSKAIVRIYESPAVEFDYFDQQICFLESSRKRRVARTVRFTDVEAIRIQLHRSLGGRATSDELLFEIMLRAPTEENFAVCISEDRVRLDEVLTALSQNTRLNVVHAT